MPSCHWNKLEQMWDFGRQNKWSQFLSKTFLLSNLGLKQIYIVYKHTFLTRQKMKNSRTLDPRRSSLMVLLICVYVMLKTQFSNTLSKCFIYFVCSNSAFLLRHNLHYIRLFDKHLPIGLKPSLRTLWSHGPHFARKTCQGQQGFQNFKNKY